MTLPTFIVIGVAKAGTTSLYRYLDQHPQVYMCSIKGTNFFGYQDAKNWRWTDEGDPPLLRHFKVKTIDAYKASFEGVKDEIAIGEVSPQYFRCPTAAQQINEYIPDVRLVASLRNPADRAFSGFLMRTRRGEPVKSVYEELTPESSHVKEGFYFKRMKRYIDIFGKEKIKISIFEEFKQDPTRSVVDLYDFLAVDPNFSPDTSTRHNPARVPKNRLFNSFFYHPTVIRTAKSVIPKSLQGTAYQFWQQSQKAPPTFPDDLRSNLLKLYREDIHKLEQLLNMDLSDWLVKID